MPMAWNLDHVALLVTSLDRALRALGPLADTLGERERFEDVGTEEAYVGGPEDIALLLLQEAVGPGPYRRALEKRGPGLHHLALSTDDFASANERLMDLGWLVHPRCLRDYRKGDSLFYVRPGVGAALELIPRETLLLGPAFVEEVRVRVEPGREASVEGLGLPGLRATLGVPSRLRIGGRDFGVDELA